MPFKINISNKDGKSFKLEADLESLIGKKLGEFIKGAEISADLAGYELQIKGASDIAGFPHKGDVEGPYLRKVLLEKGWGMHKKPRKEGKKYLQTPDGLRLKKSVRGKEISDKTMQINLVIVKEGGKKLADVFPEQNKPKETGNKVEAPAPAAQ